MTTATRKPAKRGPVGDLPTFPGIDLVLHLKTPCVMTRNGRDASFDQVIVNTSMDRRMDDSTLRSSTFRCIRARDTDWFWTVTEDRSYAHRDITEFETLDAALIFAVEEVEKSIFHYQWTRESGARTWT